MPTVKPTAFADANVTNLPFSEEVTKLLGDYIDNYERLMLLGLRYDGFATDLRAAVTADEDGKPDLLNKLAEKHGLALSEDRRQNLRQAILDPNYDHISSLMKSLAGSFGHAYTDECN